MSKPLLILTTNFDDMLERAFDRTGKPYDIVTHDFDREERSGAVLWWPHGEQEPQVLPHNKLDIDLKRTSVIYKLAGSFNRSNDEFDSYAVTEDDYIEMLARLSKQTLVPAQFFHYIRSRSFLFMGISLDNWYMRALVNALRGGDASRSRSWAILHRASAYTARLWQNRGVRIYDLPVDEFVAGLQAEQK